MTTPESVEDVEEVPPGWYLELHMKDSKTVYIPLKSQKIELNRNLCPTFFVSRKHAVMELLQEGSEEKWTICDMKSLNGTFVNQVRIEEMVPRLLKRNDLIILGESGTKEDSKSFLIMMYKVSPEYQKLLEALRNAFPNGQQIALSCLASDGGVSQKIELNLNSKEAEVSLPGPSSAPSSCLQIKEEPIPREPTPVDFSSSEKSHFGDSDSNMKVKKRLKVQVPKKKRAFSLPQCSAKLVKCDSPNVKYPSHIILPWKRRRVKSVQSLFSEFRQKRFKKETVQHSDSSSYESPEVIPESSTSVKRNKLINSQKTFMKPKRRRIMPSSDSAASSDNSSVNSDSDSDSDNNSKVQKKNSASAKLVKTRCESTPADVTSNTGKAPRRYEAAEELSNVIKFIEKSRKSVNTTARSKDGLKQRSKANSFSNVFHSSDESTSSDLDQNVRPKKPIEKGFRRQESKENNLTQNESSHAEYKSKVVEKNTTRNVDRSQSKLLNQGEVSVSTSRKGKQLSKLLSQSHERHKETSETLSSQSSKLNKHKQAIPRSKDKLNESKSEAFPNLSRTTSVRKSNKVDEVQISASSHKEHLASKDSKSEKPENLQSTSRWKHDEETVSSRGNIKGSKYEKGDPSTSHNVPFTLAAKNIKALQNKNSFKDKPNKQKNSQIHCSSDTSQDSNDSTSSIRTKVHQKKELISKPKHQAVDLLQPTDSSSDDDVSQSVSKRFVHQPKKLDQVKAKKPVDDETESSQDDDDSTSASKTRNHLLKKELKSKPIKYKTLLLTRGLIEVDSSADAVPSTTVSKNINHKEINQDIRKHTRKDQLQPVQHKTDSTLALPESDAPQGKELIKTDPKRRKSVIVPPLRQSASLSADDDDDVIVCDKIDRKSETTETRKVDSVKLKRSKQADDLKHNDVSDDSQSSRKTRKHHKSSVKQSDGKISNKAEEVKKPPKNKALERKQKSNKSVAVNRATDTSLLDDGSSSGENFSRKKKDLVRRIRETSCDDSESDRFSDIPLSHVFGDKTKHVSQERRPSHEKRTSMDRGISKVSSENPSRKEDTSNQKRSADLRYDKKPTSTLSLNRKASVEMLHDNKQVSTSGSNRKNSADLSHDRKQTSSSSVNRRSSVEMSDDNKHAKKQMSSSNVNRRSSVERSHDNKQISSVGSNRKNSADLGHDKKLDSTASSNRRSSTDKYHREKHVEDLASSAGLNLNPSADLRGTQKQASSLGSNRRSSSDLSHDGKPDLYHDKKDVSSLGLNRRPFAHLRDDGKKSTSLEVDWKSAAEVSNVEKQVSGKLKDKSALWNESSTPASRDVKVHTSHVTRDSKQIDRNAEKEKMLKKEIEPFSSENLNEVRKLVQGTRNDLEPQIQDLVQIKQDRDHGVHSAPTTTSASSPNIGTSPAYEGGLHKFQFYPDLHNVKKEPADNTGAETFTPKIKVERNEEEQFSYSQNEPLIVISSSEDEDDDEDDSVIPQMPCIIKKEPPEVIDLDSNDYIDCEDNSNQEISDYPGEDNFFPELSQNFLAEIEEELTRDPIEEEEILDPIDEKEMPDPIDEEEIRDPIEEEEARGQESPEHGEENPENDDDFFPQLSQDILGEIEEEERQQRQKAVLEKLLQKKRGQTLPTEALPLHTTQSRRFSKTESDNKSLKTQKFQTDSFYSNKAPQSSASTAIKKPPMRSQPKTQSKKPSIRQQIMEKGGYRMRMPGGGSDYRKPPSFKIPKISQNPALKEQESSLINKSQPLAISLPSSDISNSSAQQRVTTVKNSNSRLNLFIEDYNKSAQQKMPPPPKPNLLLKKNVLLQSQRTTGPETAGPSSLTSHDITNPKPVLMVLPIAAHILHPPDSTSMEVKINAPPRPKKKIVTFDLETSSNRNPSFRQPNNQLNTVKQGMVQPIFGAGISPSPTANALQSVFNSELILSLIVSWNPVWLEEQVNMKGEPPPLTKMECKDLQLHYKSQIEYYLAFFPLLLYELWESLSSSWKEKTREPEFQAKIDQCRIVSDKVVELQCKTLLPAKAPTDMHAFLALSEGMVLEVKVHLLVKDQARCCKSLGYLFFQKLQNSPDPKYKLLRFGINIRNFHSALDMRKHITLRKLQNVRLLVRQAQAIGSLGRSSLLPYILNPDYRSGPNTSDPRFKPLKIDEHPVLKKMTYNEKQKEAIRLAESAVLQDIGRPRFLLIQGPPGTGKTHLILGIIQQLLLGAKEKGRILLLAPSNAAVDEIGRRLITLRGDYKAMDKQAQAPRFVRLGQNHMIHQVVKPYSLDNLIEHRLSEYKKGVLSGTEKVARLDAKKNRLTQEIESLRSKPEHSKTRLQQKQNELRDVNQRMFDEDSKCQNLANQSGNKWNAKKVLLQNADVLLSTLNGCRQLIPADMAFSCCIVDEATQCSELEMLSPLLSFNLSKVILIGDPQQLPATVRSTKAGHHGYQQSMFERFYYSLKNTKNGNILMLTDQYRMHKEICAFPSKEFYEDKLVSIPRALKTPFPLKPYIIFDLNDSRENSGGDPRYLSNDGEAEFVVKLCREVQNVTNHNFSIGIITPYREQCKQINNRLGGQKMVEVNTVDGFQGREKDIIILSCVRSNFTGNIGFLNNRRRLNVAITRASHCLIVCGNLHSLSTKDTTWGNLASNATTRNVVCTTSATNIPVPRLVRMHCMLPSSTR